MENFHYSELVSKYNMRYAASLGSDNICLPPYYYGFRRDQDDSLRKKAESLKDRVVEIRTLLQAALGGTKKKNFVELVGKWRDMSESLKDRVVEFRTHLQAALGGTKKKNFGTFVNLQEPEAKYIQRYTRILELMDEIEHLLSEHENKLLKIFELVDIPNNPLFELNNEWRDMSESETDVMRIALDRSKSELDALEKDRNAMLEALKQTRRDICDDEDEDFGSIFTPEWSTRYDRALAYLYQYDLVKNMEAVQVDIDQTRRLQAKFENNSILALFQTRSGLAADGVHAVCAGMVVDEKEMKILVNKIHVTSGGASVSFGGMSTEVLERQNYEKQSEEEEEEEDVKEMKILVNKIHVTFGGKPTTSKDDQRYKTSVSFGGMSTEVLERHNYEKQSEEEEEEFRAVEQMLMCKVCLEEDIIIVFLPCGHMATCERCASVLDTCPVCRSQIDESLKVNYE